MKASNASLPTGNSRHRAERRALGSHRHHAASKRKGNENPRNVQIKLNVLARTSQQESTANPAHCLRKQFMLRDAGVSAWTCVALLPTQCSLVCGLTILKTKKSHIQDCKAI